MASFLCDTRRTSMIPSWCLSWIIIIIILFKVFFFFFCSDMTKIISVLIWLKLYQLLKGTFLLKLFVYQHTPFEQLHLRAKSIWWVPSILVSRTDWTGWFCGHWIQVRGHRRNQLGRAMGIFLKFDF